MKRIFNLFDQTPALTGLNFAHSETDVKTMLTKNETSTQVRL